MLGAPLAEEEVAPELIIARAFPHETQDEIHDNPHKGGAELLAFAPMQPLHSLLKTERLAGTISIEKRCIVRLTYVLPR